MDWKIGEIVGEGSKEFVVEHQAYDALDWRTILHIECEAIHSLGNFEHSHTSLLCHCVMP